MALRLEVVGAKELEASLDVLLRELDDMEGLWERVGAVMAEKERAWFESEGDGAWPPLADVTIREKAAHGWPLETLVRRGDLLESLIDPAQAMDVGQGRSTIGTFTGKSMTWGTDVRDDRGREYAHYHQHSDPVTGEPHDYGHHPPERQVIPWPLPITWQEQIRAAAEDWLDEALRRSHLD